MTYANYHSPLNKKNSIEQKLRTEIAYIIAEKLPIKQKNKKQCS